MFNHSGGNFDSHSFMNKLPGFVWSKYAGEKHMPAYQYLGPGTDLNIRLDDNLQPRPGEEPINKTDEIAYNHDINYLEAGDNLELKHEADKIMIEALKQVKPGTFGEKVAKWIAEKIISLKLKLGMGLVDDEARQIADELHKPARHNFQRRKVIAHYIDEIHTGDLMDFTHSPISGKGSQKFRYVLVNMDVFSKYAWIFFMPTKETDNLIDCYKQIFQKRKPKYLWWDQERGIFSDKFKKFLNVMDVSLYHTYSELKAVCAERLIRTLKFKCEKLRTQYELQNKKFKLFDVLPDAVNEYNNTVHSTTELTPVEASEEDNQDKLRNRYIDDHNSYNPANGKLYKVGDYVRLYKWKKTFEKGYTPTFTKEIFVVSEVMDSKPVTYQIRSLDGEEIQGKVYSWELTQCGKL